MIDIRVPYGGQPFEVRLFKWVVTSHVHRNLMQLRNTRPPPFINGRNAFTRIGNNIFFGRPTRLNLNSADLDEAAALGKVH